ncbi:MAG: leucine-rich repeat domain-containing protein [Pseudomonadota bacterium]|nr:leucine-rich repeat domain-containing protein [Pseudomonadota bacterium]
MAAENRIGDAGAAVVAAALAANDALTSLELRYNAIGDVGARHLARALEG